MPGGGDESRGQMPVIHNESNPRLPNPIGFSRSGIWVTSSPGFGILKEVGDEIRDCDYDRDTGFGDFNKRESENVALKKPRFRNSRG